MENMLSTSQSRSRNSPWEGSFNLAAQRPLCFSVNPVGVDSVFLLTVEENREEKKEREKKKERKKNILKPQCLYILTVVFEEFVRLCCILLG